MCGIVGYVGTRDVVPVLIEGLRKLEYRGYDSAGIAVVNGDEVSVLRAEGKLANLEKKLESTPLAGQFGLGHTRWATHGKPNENNAHPHRDCTGRIVVIHNGIIENFLALKQQLQKEGHEFKTETDTEVVAHLIEKNAKKGFIEAARSAIEAIHGHYALVILSADEPGTIFAARQGPPLVIGVGEGENIVASDVTPLLAYTREILYLDDGEYAIVERDRVRIFDRENQPVARKPKRINWDAVAAEKEGYKHFMLKEIHEQPRAVQETFTGRMFEESGEVYFNDLEFTPEQWRKFRRIHIVACGTSWHAGLVGKFLLEDAARLQVEVDYGSEYRYRDPVTDESTLVIGVTQSGETADTIAGMQEAKRRGATLMTICNVLGSAATRISDGVIYTNAGPEIGVASTKAFTTQLTAFYLFSLYVRQLLGGDKQDLRYAMHELAVIPEKLERILRTQHEADREARAQVREGAGLPLPRARGPLPHRARGSAQAQGDLLHPRRGLSGGRDEARADRAHRREPPRRRHRHAQPRPRQSHLQPPGSEGARGDPHRHLRRGRRGGDARWPTSPSRSRGPSSRSSPSSPSCRPSSSPTTSPFAAAPTSTSRATSRRA